MSDQVRIESLIKEDLGLYIDFSRQRMTQDTQKVGGGAVRAAGRGRGLDVDGRGGWRHRGAMWSVQT